MTPTVRVQAEDFDAAAEATLLTQGRTDIGAVVTVEHELGVLERSKSLSGGTSIPSSELTVLGGVGDNPGKELGGMVE